MTSAASFPANSTPKLADPSRSARPRLSVVVLSCEKAAGLAGTLPTLLDALRVMEAELVVVRTVEAAGDDDLGLQALARVIIAGPGATRSECVDLGMSMVRGDIVLVRDDAQLRELDWLRPLARVVGVERHFVDAQREPMPRVGRAADAPAELPRPPRVPARALAKAATGLAR